MKGNDFLIAKAKFYLKKTKDGGRKFGIISGYRPNHVFEYKEGEMVSAYIGEIKFDKQSKIEPGEERIVTVRFFTGQKIEHFLTIGKRWWIHEGPRQVGTAITLEVEEKI